MIITHRLRISLLPY